METNAKMVEQMRLEAKEAEAKRVEEMKELEEENRRKREKVITDKAGIDRAQEKLMEAGACVHSYPHTTFA